MPCPSWRKGKAERSIVVCCERKGGLMEITLGANGLDLSRKQSSVELNTLQEVSGTTAGKPGCIFLIYGYHSMFYGQTLEDNHPPLLHCAQPPRD